MKNFLTALGLFLVVLLIWSLIGATKFDRNTFLPSSVLDKAAPLNVNIDIEFIKSLKNPAYGSNGQ
jgi:ABC-type nitrate/sulfonate/bicarbonate transport system permease component